MVRSQPLAGRVAIVTAAGRGIGRACALRLATAGASVVVNDLHEGDLAAVVEALQTTGAEAEGVIGDVTEPALIAELVDTAFRRFGRIDVLHNNAGLGIPAPLHEIPVEDWRRQFAVTVDAAFFATRCVIPHMRSARDGSIINTASGAGLAAEPLFGAYTAAKHALIGLTRATAIENARWGIRANAVCPGTILTPAFEARMDSIPGGSERYARAHPQGRLGSPDEVASLVAFLAGPESAHVNGAVIPIDGGISAARAAPSVASDVP